MVPGNEKFPKITGRDLTHFFDLFWSKFTFLKKVDFFDPVILQKVADDPAAGRRDVKKWGRPGKSVVQTPLWTPKSPFLSGIRVAGGPDFGRPGGRFLDPLFLSANFFEKVKSLCGTRKWKIPKNNGKRFDPFFRPFLVKIHLFKKSGLFRPGDFTKSGRRPGGGSTGREKVGSTREIGRSDPPLNP